MSQFRAIVHGKVQGVYFRAETVSRARSLRLGGYARNLPDGTVEVLAAGEEGALNDLLEYLHTGPTLAEVKHVDVDWNDRSAVGSDFSVRY